MTSNNLDLKDEVSILMNCYNGEQFLKQSIESVFKQSYTNWKIFFVDNCSEDGSEEIAKSFGEKIHYHRTKKNVSLAEARAFGIKKCTGKYLMFLDVDDRYQPNTIKILLNEIICFSQRYFILPYSIFGFGIVNSDLSDLSFPITMLLET